jgi:hypothetical protein
MLAAPIPGDSVARVTQPGLFMVAEEDNSIGVAGNDAIEQNYDNYPAQAWLVKVKDAGHWSFSDIAGMTDVFAPGCGTAKRQSDPAQTFTYLDPTLGRGIAQAYVAAFFGAKLLNETGAAAYLTRAKPEGVVTVAQR